MLYKAKFTVFFWFPQKNTQFKQNMEILIFKTLVRKITAWL
jgi:hypothetical protein